MVSKLRDAGVADAGANGRAPDLADLLRGFPY
jgi:hypothetical protein